MSFLRTVSTPRLLAILAGVAAAIAAGAAIAVAATGSGPVPRATSLPRAIHSALAAPSVQGITARISFSNNVIDSSDIQGSDPILTGASGRLWFSPSTHQLRLELQSDNGDAQALVSNGSFWVYDPSARTVYEGAVPSRTGGGSAGKADNEKSAKREQLPSVNQIQSELTRDSAHANISGALPSDVAGRAAYTVRVSPKHDGGLLGSAELAWDAARGVPLRIAVYARGNSSPIFELKATDISFGPVPASDFKVSPPHGAKVVKVTTAGDLGKRSGHRPKDARRQPQVMGAAAVAAHLPFKLVAPKTLVGLPRQSVTLLDWGGSPAALVTYGQHLGAIAVVEQTYRSGQQQSTSSGGRDHQGLSLPTVSINGTTGQELNTALGTVVRFSRGAVTYTVAGSVPAAAADAAARAL